MRTRFGLLFLILVMVFAIAVPFARAQQVPLTPEQRAALEQELKQVEAQIAAQEAILKTQQAQSSSLARDIAILNAKIEKAKLDIRAKTILIQSLSKDIGQKQVVIGNLSDKIDRETESLGQMLRKANEIESYSLPEVLLTQDDISSFFQDIDNFDSLKRSLHDSFTELKSAKDQTTVQKKTLETKRDVEADAKAAIEASKRDIETNQAQLNNLLSFSKQQEKNYAQVIKERAARAAQIRSALFALRDSAAIPFAKAYEYAVFASQKTGIRPAFLLAILTQESSLGKDVGSCLVTNFDTGAGIRFTNGQAIERVMKPDRDVAPFKLITSELGYSPSSTRVSCPFTVGYGGAMGPAQFIPSTWMLMKNRLASALGVSTPNPWEPKDAFMASALFLSDLGASSQSYTAERNAACRYYSGTGCGSGTGTFYGNQVMTKARNIQENMIDLITNN